MKSQLRTAPRRGQRRTALVAALLFAPALVACGFDAQTDQVYQAAQGVNDRSGDVWILNALIVSGKDGSGTFAGSFANHAASTQTLTDLTGDQVQPNGDHVKVEPTQLVNLGLPAKGTGLPQLSLTGTGIKVGGFVRLTFTFSGGSTSTLDVPVVSNDGSDGAEFANVPLPSDLPTIEPIKSPNDAPTDGAATPSGGATE